MKSIIVNVRVPEYLNDQLQEESLHSGQSISEVLRNIISDHYSLTVREEDLYTSNRYIFLIVWIFQKKGQPQDHSNKQTLIDLKNTVFEVVKDNQLPIHLVDEFEKLLFDLQRYINEFGTENNQFRFCALFHEHTFDYAGLSEYIAYKASENRIQL